MNYDRDALIADLTRDEGVRTHLYLDSLGHESIGIGRNLANGLHDSEIALMLSNDIDTAVTDLDTHLPWWRAMDPVRQRVLANMIFNLGWPKLAGFKRMLAAAHAHRWDDAAHEMGDSKWALQVGERAVRLQAMMRTGAEPS